MNPVIAWAIVGAWVVAMPFMYQIADRLADKYNMFRYSDSQDLALFFTTICWPVGVPIILSAVAGKKARKRI